MSENAENMPGASQNQAEAQDDGWIDIARAGTFTPSNGKTTTITKDDLDLIVKGFDANKRRVPLVFGHPKTSAPAYGWVEALQMKGDILQARFRQIHDDVKTLVKKGNFKNISISISPDKRSLLHVGLLGAAAPAIDGLKEVSFAHETICIDFSMEDAGEIERLKAELAETKERLQQYERGFQPHNVFMRRGCPLAVQRVSRKVANHAASKVLGVLWTNAHVLPKHYKVETLILRMFFYHGHRIPSR